MLKSHSLSPNQGGKQQHTGQTKANGRFRPNHTVYVPSGSELSLQLKSRVYPTEYRKRLRPSQRPFEDTLFKNKDSGGPWREPAQELCVFPWE